MLRLTAYNFKKKQEEFQKQIQELENQIKIKSSQIFRLEVQVSDLKFKTFKPKKKLCIMKVQNTDIQPDLPASECCNLKSFNLAVR